MNSILRQKPSILDQKPSILEYIDSILDYMKKFTLRTGTLIYKIKTGFT